MDARWHEAAEQLRARERAVHYFCFWLRELTACLAGRARSEACLRDLACALFVFLTVRLGLLRLIDLLLGPLAVLVATSLCPLACFSPDDGLGVGLAVVRAAMQGRFGSAHCAARRAQRVHMRDAGSAWVVERHVARFGTLPPLPCGVSLTGTQLWWDGLVDRLPVVSGWSDVPCLGRAGHFVGLTWEGEVLCSLFGRVRVGNVGEAAREILQWIPRVEEFWFFLLPLLCAVGERPGAHPVPPHTPCWEPRVAGRRLFPAATTTAADWLAHYYLVRAFVDNACAFPPVHR